MLEKIDEFRARISLKFLKDGNFLEKSDLHRPFFDLNGVVARTKGGEKTSRKTMLEVLRSTDAMCDALIKGKKAPKPVPVPAPTPSKEFYEALTPTPGVDNQSNSFRSFIVNQQIFERKKDNPTAILPEISTKTTGFSIKARQNIHDGDTTNDMES